jgi:arsenite methyltransferase
MADDETDGAPDHAQPARVTADGGTPSFGIDAPPILLTFIALGVAAAIAAAFTGGSGNALTAIGPAVAAVLLFAAAGYMVYGSVKGKAGLWEEALDDLAARGDEDALDLGCGRGLVLIGLAQRLPEGHVTGIDLWRSRDQTGNSRAAAEGNVAAAGVTDRVELVDGDMTDLPFDDASFDIVTASLSLHHIPLAADRRKAVQELVRVLRAGGRIVIVDNGKTGEFVAELDAAELADVERSGPRWSTYPPSRIVTAQKVTGNARSARDRRQQSD